MKVCISSLILLFVVNAFAASAAVPYPDSLSAAEQVEQAVAKTSSNKDSSLLLLENALKVFKKNNDLHSWITACSDVGVGFDMAGDAETALFVYRKAQKEQLFRQPTNVGEWNKLGWLYVNEGYTLYWSQGKYYEAKPNYETAKSIFEEKAKSVDATVAAYVHRELGNIYTRLGDYEAALVLLQQVRKVALTERSFNLAAEACSDIGLVYYNIGKDSLAINIYREALDNYPDLNIISKGLLEGNLAMTYERMNDREAALSFNKKAIKTYEIIVKNDLHPVGKLWLANQYKLLGELNGAEKTGEANLKTALNLLKEYYPDTLRREFGKARLSLADYYRQQGRLDEALLQQQLALQSVLYRFRENDPLANPDPKDFLPENTVIEALVSKADVLSEKYEQTKDRKYLEKSMDCYDLVFDAEKVYRQVLHFESSKLNILGILNGFTESALKNTYQDGKEPASLERAFAFTEKSKSILLYEALRHSDARSIANVPDSLLQQEKQLKEMLTDLEKQVYFEKQKPLKNEVAVGQLENAILDHNTQLTNLTQKFEKDYPSFFDLKYKENAATVAQTQQLLRPNQALVEYFVGDSTIFIFLLKKDAFHVERVAKNFPLEQWVTEFRQGIEAFQHPSNDRENLCESYTGLAQKLYQKLMQPLEKQGLPQDIIIVPGGVLGFLPFDALLYQAPPAPCIFKKYPYLALRHNISYNYSSTLFKELMTRPRNKPTAGFAGFAPTFEKGNKSGFNELKFNVLGTEEIARMIGGQAFIGPAANGQAFFENAGKHSILYLGTHAKANSDEGGFSFIVLAGANGGYDTVFVKDIYNLPLSSDLVFLGACETGSGKLYNGEGIISLARSFLFAGAKSIVTTLWSINDESNNTLTISFFRNLDDGMRKDEALWQAKKELLSSDSPDLYAHPVFWAAYTPIGNMEPLKTGGFAWWWLAAGLGVVGVAYWGAKRLAVFSSAV